MSNDPSTILKELSTRQLTVLVFFRGSWCPFCQAYLREIDGKLRAEVERAGGRLFAITSQSTQAAGSAHRDWGLHYEVVSDPDNTLAAQYGVSITPKAETPLADDPNEYPRGMAQPAVVGLDSSGEVLYRWAIVPAEMNLGGASDRPLPDEIWQAIDAKRKGGDAPAAGAGRLDPSFLEANYPQLHERFLAWVASKSS